MDIAAEVAKKLNRVEAASIIAISEQGERGAHIDFGPHGFNWAAVAILERRRLGMFTGGRTADGGWSDKHVQLTPFGHEVRGYLDKAALSDFFEPAALAEQP